MSKLLILCALEEELPPEHNPYKDITVYTGIGKVNAALEASKAIYSLQPTTIINFGTVGACHSNISGLVECGIFSDRDDAFKFNEETLITTTPSLLRLSTGDNFVTSLLEDCDVVDMEAYAIAKACHLNGVYFKCFKYITDYISQSSYRDWYNNVSKGYPLFLEKMNDYIKNPV